MIDSDNRKPILLVALGGNAMIKKGQEGTAVQQRDNLKVTVRQIARLSQTHRIIITHGNGPQVGNLLLQQECCDAVPKMPLDILVAQTQGQIGYMIESCLDSELMAQNLNSRPLVSLISYVVVDENDPAFKTPTKPIGPLYTKTQAKTASWPFCKTAKGYRRVTFSPKPITIVEKHEIKQLIDMDFIVICCGGGGIPVIREGRAFSGIEAVIDKDLASARLAVEVGADLFVIATDVKGVAINFGQKNQKILRTLTLADARKYMRAGHFSEGSMKPKVEAAVQFAGIPGKRAVVAFLEEIELAVAGKAGTEFVA
ncbi:carbamate kinase [Desulfobacula phenolica]|uniref:Carbamate kinase n=1 Tax=Desulfobacula phenolica TaxID=90732 RepID=A0A1H2JRD9_9BACT|nr:carbamate kinase [Desulfobacula phenolica]SDU58738.1 carbamate kinase [Desulfobacula phenolica]